MTLTGSSVPAPFLLKNGSAGFNRIAFHYHVREFRIHARLAMKIDLVSVQGFGKTRDAPVHCDSLVEGVPAGNPMHSVGLPDLAVVRNEAN